MSTSNSSAWASQNRMLCRPLTHQHDIGRTDPGRTEHTFELRPDPLGGMLQHVKQEDDKEQTWEPQGYYTNHGLWSQLPPTDRAADVAASGMGYALGPSLSQVATRQSSSSPLASGGTFSSSLLKTPKSTPWEAESNRRGHFKHSPPLDPPEAVPSSPAAAAQDTLGRPDSDTLPLKSMQSGDRFGLQVSEAKRIKDIEEALHCFWLVSENRMSQMQQDIVALRARLDSTFSEQGSINAKLEQALALQARTNHQATRAAELSGIVLDGIKTLNRSTLKGHEEVKCKLEEVRTHFADGLETMIELAPKARRIQMRKAAVQAIESKSNKRPKPPGKKCTSSAARKNKTQVPQDEMDLSAVQPPDATPTIASPGKLGISTPSPQFSHASMEQERPYQQQQLQVNRIRLCDDQPQPQPQRRYDQPTSQPSASYDQVQHQPRPPPATLCRRESQQGLGPFEVSFY